MESSREKEPWRDADEGPESMSPSPADRSGQNEDEKEEHEDGEKQQDKVDGADLSSINTIMSTVMSATHLDRAAPSSPGTNAMTEARTAAKSTTGKRTQLEAKEEPSAFTCPLCQKNCLTQHQLTMHIRQHNQDNGATDHSCSICGKSLSSASSLDRHMLVHSGERPYKCSVCSQTFTTNGNMHRHMKIHDKDLSVASSSPPSPIKRRRTSTKRKSSSEADGDRREESCSKKLLEETSTAQQNSARDEEAQLPCPICFRTFACKFSLETHMEMHPDASFRCDLCCITFRTHRSLFRHNASIHKVLPTDRDGLPFIQNNPSIPLGFNDLAFIDFSCCKFPHIAQVWCETNLRRCSSKFHRFVCEICNKAFPLQLALNLHMATHSESKDPEPKDSINQLDQDTPGDPEKLGFMASLGLQPVSQMKPVPSEDELWQAELDSIRFIRVQPTKLDLPQDAGLPLLDPVTLHNLSQNNLSVLSLQPFQKGFVLQPDSGLVINPICGEAGMELADIQQILKMASNQITLPHFAKGQCNAANLVPKPMPQLKPKPLAAPRSSMAASTPPPLTSAHQALPGSISPNLPPPPNHMLKSPGESSSTSSSKNACMDRMQMEADCMGDALTPMDADRIKQEEEGGREVSSTNTPKVGERKAPYPCRFCSQTFAFPGLLQAHMRYHLGIAPHQCNICDYVAPDKATLIRHLRTHSGERPYVCRVCSYPFTVKANCERHLRKKHMKNSRKDIEKNIEYVSSQLDSTINPLDPGCSGTTSPCCGENLKKYRASQVHLPGHNGCPRKVFKCCQCETLFIAKSVCIQHLLEKHSEVQEREIEDHITTILIGTASQGSTLPRNGLFSSHCPSLVKVEDRCSSDPDEPLDFSCKSRGVASESLGALPGVKLEGLQCPQLSYDCSFLPIDLSVSKNPGGSLKRTSDTVSPGPAAKEVKKDPASCSSDDLPHAQELQSKCDGGKPTEESLKVESCSAHGQLSLPLTSPLNGIPASTTRASKLKPLLPKPAVSSVKELPPLASIAQIISSVSAASDLLKRESTSSNLGKTTSKGFQADSEQSNIDQSSHETSKEESSMDKSNKKGRKKSSRIKERPNNDLSNPSSGIDLESSGEFASVEKMLATTDANKFSPYLSSPVVLEKEEVGGPTISEEEKELKDSRQQNMQQQQPKVKKNAYSNSVQKMNCPFCPRVFPWASSLQRHMLTHTGQKPYPCPNCDALFSTKSNCERHLLRKHGVANRAMRRNGAVPKAKDADEGSPESAESMSETEFPPPDPVDLVDAEPAKESAEPQKAFSEEAESPGTEQPTQTGETENHGNQEGAEPAEENMTDDDSQSNQSLDLDFATKLIDFRFSESNQEESPSRGAAAPEDPKHSCKSCKKNFRFAATLARHETVHVQDSHGKVGGKEDAPSTSCPPEDRPQEKTRSEERKTAVGSEGADSGSEEEDEEREGKSDEDSGTVEPKSSKGERRQAAATKVEKRKKICSVCSKRFWSLQDLTRHTRSHTGERPYKCQTCERTFTLKHSLVRHQRIHQKPRDAEAEGASSRSGSESESVVCGTGPASETESEAQAAEGPQAMVPNTEGPQVMVPTVEGPLDEPARNTTEEAPGQYVQGLLDIHSKPSMELILSASEAPLVGAE